MFNTRVDMQSIEGEKGYPSSTQFQMKRMRLFWKGETENKLFWGMRYNFLNDADSTAGNKGTNLVDGTPGGLNYAFLGKKFDNGVKFKAGKIFINAGGFEGDYNGSDVYTYSAQNDGLIPVYEVGASVSYMFMGHSVMLDVFNANKSTGTYDGDAKPNQRKLGYGVAFRPSLMKDKLMLNVSYHIDPQSAKTVGATTAKKGDFTHLNLGVKFKHMMMVFDLDYFMNTHENGSENVLNKDVEHTTFVGQFKYDHKMWKPFVKYIMEETEDMGGKKTSDSYDITAYDLGVECYPYKDANFRYHLVYSSKEVESKATGASKFTVNTITFGAKYQLDLFSML